MAESFATRRDKLQRVLVMVQELINLNARGESLDTQLKNQGVSQAEREITLNKLFDGAGPPKKGSSVALDECTEDTVTDRIINILNGAITDGVDWDAEGAST